VADPAAVDAAVIAKLLADTALMTTCTDKVYRDLAPQGATRFVIVNLQDAHTERQFNQIGFEEYVYLVKAVVKGKSGIDANTAAARIDALLENGGAGGSLGIVTGYGVMTTGRIEDGWRVRYTEADPDNEDERWQHAGGLYSVWVSPS
jgi:hypothetical protein